MPPRAIAHEQRASHAAELRAKKLSQADCTWRGLPPEYDGAAQSTIEALMWELREYGIERLANEDTKRRIADLAPSQVRQVTERLTRLQENYPLTISRELVAFFEELLKWQS